MLKVNVGLSRKLSQNFNSQGMSINFEAEITAPIHDSDAVIQQVKEIFDLADEALDQQAERTRSIDAQASHDAPPTSPANFPGTRMSTPRTNSAVPAGGNGNRLPYRQTPSEPVREEPATNKQIQYLISIGKRQRRSTADLERQVQDILQRPIGVYDLSKREAAHVIDMLSKGYESRSVTSRF